MHANAYWNFISVRQRCYTLCQCTITLLYYVTELMPLSRYRHNENIDGIGSAYSVLCSTNFLKNLRNTINGLITAKIFHFVKKEEKKRNIIKIKIYFMQIVFLHFFFPDNPYNLLNIKLFLNLYLFATIYFVFCYLTSSLSSTPFSCKIKNSSQYYEKQTLIQSKKFLLYSLLI